MYFGLEILNIKQEQDLRQSQDSLQYFFFLKPHF